VRDSGRGIFGLRRGASHLKYCDVALALVDRSTPRLPGLQSHCKTSVSVPAQLSPGRASQGASWSRLGSRSVRTVLIVLWQLPARLSSESS
jgi:hypothetical protein